jgi:hypothetical protein
LGETQTQRQVLQDHHCNTKPPATITSPTETLHHNIKTTQKPLDPRRTTTPAGKTATPNRAKQHLDPKQQSPDLQQQPSNFQYGEGEEQNARILKTRRSTTIKRKSSPERKVGNVVVWSRELLTPPAMAVTF